MCAPFEIEVKSQQYSIVNAREDKHDGQRHHGSQVKSTTSPLH